MYFVKPGSEIYHILADERTGASLCGQTASRYDLWKYQQGEPTENFKEELPPDKPLCKHCEAMRGE